ncbi:triphosphoribosyl-dephospho-CoA synthase MdcB [Methylocella sp.]|uniref:triphosphoribosyl-dephospho-CoA synthase MdcB n=1 Tax=Methylocella sp. TaxID=1978226 RepID=UPI0037848E99
MTGAAALRRAPAPRPRGVPAPRALGALAARCLRLEVDTFPKPGLVSHVDNGSHHDMTAGMLRRSADALEPYFTALAEAGARYAPMDELRVIGLDAEAAMMKATGGVNAHRGAIFGLGLFCAVAAAPCEADPGEADFGEADPGETTLGETTLGEAARRRYGEAVLKGPVALLSHGTGARRRFGAQGARGEAAAGFQSVYRLGLPALEDGARLAPCDAEAMRVHACFALIAAVEDTNLLHRGGAEGLAFAQAQARDFLAQGGVGAPDWRRRAERVHAAFVRRRLSPGGSADLLAFSLFARAVEGA